MSLGLEFSFFATVNFISQKSSPMHPFTASADERSTR